MSVHKRQQLGIYIDITNKKAAGQKAIAVLIDPEVTQGSQLIQVLSLAERSVVDYLFVGGSTATASQMEECLKLINEFSTIPCLIFPGSPEQINDRADALLFLSLLSGRNAELLIGKQVESVPTLRQCNLEIIPTGYLLIDGGNETTVAKISKTLPLSQTDPEAITNTALAGQYLGMQLIYLEAGSGAKNPVHNAIISQVSEALTIPLIVGGGLRTTKDADTALAAGADLIVVGNILEKEPTLIPALTQVVKKYNKILSQ